MTFPVNIYRDDLPALPRKKYNAPRSRKAHNGQSAERPPVSLHAKLFRMIEGRIEVVAH